MTLLEAAKQALDALENVWSNGIDELTTAPIEALRQAIEQAEKQEPVAKYSDVISDGGLDPRNKFYAPPQREWVGLTDGEKLVILARRDAAWLVFANEIEAKLKEKNT